MYVILVCERVGDGVEEKEKVDWNWVNLSWNNEVKEKY